MSTRKFNYIYDQLVRDKEDLVGLIAYSYYKQKKIAHVRNICGDDKDCDVPEEKLQEFHRISVYHIDDYRAKAEEILLAFLDNAVEDTIVQLEKVKYAEIKREKLQVREDIRKSKTSLREGVLHSMLGSAAFLFMIGAFLMVLIGYRSGVDTIVNELNRIVTGIEFLPAQTLPSPNQPKPNIQN